MKKPIFEDAQQMQKDNPTTFYAPSQQELEKLTVNDLAKVCVQGERFWCIIKQINDQHITGEINNDLVFTHKHGLSDTDVIEFEKKNIYNIILENEL